MTDKERIDALRAALAWIAEDRGRHPAERTRETWEAGTAIVALRADDEAARQGEPCHICGDPRNSPGGLYCSAGHPDPAESPSETRGGLIHQPTRREMGVDAPDFGPHLGQPSPPGPPAPPTRGMWGEGGAGPGRVYCDLPPDGWRCTRERSHEGPCVAVPEDYTALESIERLQAQVVHLAGRLGEAHRERDALAQRLESITPGTAAEPSPEAREAAREWGMSELIVGMPVRHRSTGLIGTVRDPDYRHRYTRRDGEVAEWECVLVEWPDDEWCGVVAREELERVASSPTDEDTLDGETSWPPPEVTS